jgi:hypothetical protein
MSSNSSSSKFIQKAYKKSQQPVLVSVYSEVHSKIVVRYVKGVNIIKLFFSSSLTAGQNKLDRFYLATFTYSQVLRQACEERTL